MRNVIVSGATRGLGLALVRRLHADGFRVIGMARRLSDEFAALQQAADADTVAFVSLDLSETERIAGAVQEVTRRFGPIYGLVNNAAVGRDGVLATMHNKDIAGTVELNLVAPLILTKYASRSMLTRRSGRIVMVSSIIASSGFTGLSVYGATKAALNGFTRCLAREVGRFSITVNAVAPGFMETEMTDALGADDLARIRRRSPMNRFVSVDEVAAAVGFLMGDAASGITGTVTTVDAGGTA